MSRFASRLTRARRVRPIGLSIGYQLTWIDAANRQAQLTKMKSANVGWVRIDANWDSIQYGGATSWDWGPLDAAINDTLARGFEILLMPTYTPVWARQPGLETDMFSSPSSVSYFAAFVTALVQRYRPKGVKHYEIWNEPNIPNFWRDTAASPYPNPVHYTELLIASYNAIKAVSNDCVVITGGTAPSADSISRKKPTTFLQAIYDNGGKNYFDAVAHHPYTYPAFPNQQEVWSAWSQMSIESFYGGSQTQPSLRGIMTANGDAHKKIWMTEFGAPTSGTNGVSETDQATMLQQAMALHRSYSWAGPLFVYTWRDKTYYGDPTLNSGGTPKANDIENYFGMTRSDDSNKPSYDIFKTV